MGDKPFTRADLEGFTAAFTAALNALSTQVAILANQRQHQQRPHHQRKQQQTRTTMPKTKTPPPTTTNTNATTNNNNNSSGGNSSFSSHGRLSHSLLASIEYLETKQYSSPRMYQTLVKDGYDEGMKEQISKDLRDGGKKLHDADMEKKNASVDIDDEYDDFYDSHDPQTEDIMLEVERYGNKILVTDELPDGQMVAQWEPVSCDSMKTPLEVYEELQVVGYLVDYEPVAITDEKSLMEPNFDILAKEGESNQILSFAPFDGQFKLVNYRVRKLKTNLIYVKPQFVSITSSYFTQWDPGGCILLFIGGGNLHGILFIRMRTRVEFF